jgi:PPOX class probable F420-dependent enzyme
MGALDVATSPAATIAPPVPAHPVSPPSRDAVMRSLVRLHDQLARARVIWLSSTRPDGRPHVVPTWFDWDGELITIFARPHAQKVRNVLHQPVVMLAIGSADPTFEVELLEGHARVVPADALGQPVIRPSAAFRRRYADALQVNGGSLESFAAEYPVALRIRPTRLLDYGARQTSRSLGAV